MALTVDQVTQINTAKATIEVLHSTQDQIKTTAQTDIDNLQSQIMARQTQRDADINVKETEIAIQQTIINSFVGQL